MIKHDKAVFESYIEMNDMSTAFGNSDWCNVYTKIVGSSENDKIKEWLEIE